MSPVTELLLTTHPGLEDIVSAELCRRAAAAGVQVLDAQAPADAVAGRVRVHVGARRDEAVELAQALRSIHHVLLPIGAFEISPEDPLGSLERAVAEMDVPELEGARSFRVSTERIGDHPFTSLDIQRVAGAVLQRRYGTPVDLERYEVHVRVDVVGLQGWVALQLTREPLSRRVPRVRHHPAALQPNVAYALLELARITPECRRMLDPFCGSGTILIEAAREYPWLELYGLDRHGPNLDGARENLAAARARASLVQADALRLPAIFRERTFDRIVTNPPYGVRQGRGLDFHRFYARLLASASRVLRPAGRMVLIVRRRGPLNAVLRRARDFEIEHVRIIRVGDLYPGIFVLRRR